MWHQSESRIGSIAVDYFSNLLHSCQPSQIESIADCLDTQVTQEENMLLMAPVTDEEIREAVFQIPHTIAPGPDGFSGIFYQDHWEVVGKDVTHMIKAF